jgi:hypothetical protein
MAFITELDVVNRCLSTMGELPINSLEGTRNPIVTNARVAFNDVNIEEQAQGWWFNTEIVSLLPQTSTPGVPGIYRPPTDCLSLSTVGDFNPEWLSIRNRQLYDNGKAEYHTGTQPMRVKIVRLVPFDDLPYNAQRLIRDSVVFKFQMDYDGDELKIQQAEARYTEAYAICMADHTRSVKANLLYKGAAGSTLARSRIPYGATGRWRT